MVFTKDEEAELWSIIESLNWKDNCHLKDTDVLSEKLLAPSLGDVVLKLRLFLDSKHSDLYSAIGKYEYKNDTHCGSYGGDDNFDDMINHTIGLGRDVYEEVLNNPEVLNTRKDLGSDFVESFSYCIPFDIEGYRSEHGVNEPPTLDC